MPNPEEPIKPEVAPPEVVPPTPAPPSFGLSGAPSSPWWAAENFEDGEDGEDGTDHANGAFAGGPGIPATEPPLLPDAILPPGTVTGPQQPGAALPPPGPQKGTSGTSSAPGAAGEPIWPAAEPATRPTSGPTTGPTTGPTAPPWPAPPPGPPGPTSGATTMPMAAPVPNVEPTMPTPTIGPPFQPGGGPPLGDGPPGAGPPAPPDVKRGLSGRRRLILVAAGGVAAVAIAIAGVTVGSGSSQPKAASGTAAPTGGAAAPPNSAPANSPGNAAPSIDNERTDRRPLRLTDIFPVRPLPLGGRVYKQNMTSVNHDCALVARGAMAQALVRGHCRSVVRATYVDTKKKFAVTAGVVAMPTRTLALAARNAGDPSQYEWFRGMAGKMAKNIDQAGGYAASTVRGRYIIYSYATYLDGHGAAANDTLLATVGRQFVAFAVRPIEQRSR